jgi:hypothetical protein
MYDETGYHPPDWSAVPKEPFNLEVLKDGLIIDTIHLADKVYFTLGRQHDIVDIPMDHPSISRIHAVLNYRNDGSLMLLDLNSAQGTYLNKSICEKNVYHRVYVGDIIKFGASTRKYIVNGPDEQRLPEYNSANLINLREKLQSRSQEIKRKLERDNECSWGFSEHSEEDYSATSSTAHADGDRDIDDGDEADSRRSRFRSGDKGLADLPEYLKNDENYDRKYGDKYAISISESSLKNEKDTAIHDKIRVKERKIQNMQEENRRIYLKESSQDGGLTEGQMNAVKRNDANILQHKNDIDNLVKQLQIKEQDRNRNNSSINGSGGDCKKRGGDEDDDEEKLLDETSGNIDVETNFRLKKKLKRNQLRFHGADGGDGSRAVANSRALSYQDINSEMNSNNVKLSMINEQMNVLNKNIEFLVSTIGSDYDGRSAKYSSSSSSNLYRDASIDDIIVTNQIQEYKLKLTALTAEKLELESKRQGLQKLLVIATPALESLVQKSSTKYEVKVKVGSKELVGSISNDNANADTIVYASHPKDVSHTKIMDSVSKDESSDAAVSVDNIMAITDYVEAMISKSPNHDDDINKADCSNNMSIDIVEGLADTSLNATAVVVTDMLSVNTVIIDVGITVRDSKSNTSPTVINHESSLVKDEHEHEHVNESVGGSSTAVDRGNCINHDDNINIRVDQKKCITLPQRAKTMSTMNSKAVKVMNEDQLSFKSDVLEGGEYVWVPPKMQTGDGKTSLNAKYGY